MCHQLRAPGVKNVSASEKAGKLEAGINSETKSKVRQKNQTKKGFFSSLMIDPSLR